jgi:hypothetical protein
MQLRRISEQRRLLSFVNRHDWVIRQKGIQFLRQICEPVITLSGEPLRVKGGERRAER